MLLRRGLTALVLVALLVAAVRAQVPVTGAGTSGTLVAAFTAFDPATKTGNVGFTNSNLTLSASSPSCGSANTCGAQTLTGQSSGKRYFTATFTLAGATNFNDAVGVTNSGVSVNTCANTNSTGCAFWSSRGGIFVNNATACAAGTCGTWTNADEIDVALDTEHRTIWFRKNHTGNWNGSALADPTTNTGGFDVSALNATLFGFVGIATSTGGTHEGPATGNFGASAFTSAPTAYTGWAGP